jgi:hypothetical protein
LSRAIRTTIPMHLESAADSNTMASDREATIGPADWPDRPEWPVRLRFPVFSMRSTLRAAAA